MARRERLFEALGRLVAWERERERRSPKPHRARSAPSANQAPRIAPTKLCDQRSTFQPLRTDVVEVIEVVGERGVHVGKREVRVCVDDLVRRHAEMLDLAGDLADLDVRAGDHGPSGGVVDAVGTPSCFHRGLQRTAWRPFQKPATRGVCSRAPERWPAFARPPSTSPPPPGAAIQTVLGCSSARSAQGTSGPWRSINQSPGEFKQEDLRGHDRT